MIAGQQAFTWIHRNSLSQKIQENSCKHRKTRYFPKVHRTVNIGKQGKMPVFNCKPRVNVKFYTGKTSVNTGKQVIRQELTDRSIPENRRFPGFTVMGKYRIMERILKFTDSKTIEKPWIFRSVNTSKCKQMPHFAKLHSAFSTR